eukprot:11055574-Lingulodinium_polyedra.AAC.1
MQKKDEFKGYELAGMAKAGIVYARHDGRGVAKSLFQVVDDEVTGKFSFKACPNLEGMGIRAEDAKEIVDRATRNL